MPFVAVHLARGRPLDKRRRIAEAITDAISEILELDRGQTQVLIHEHERDNWAIGGELLSERRAASAPDLPDLDALFRKPPNAAKAETAKPRPDKPKPDKSKPAKPVKAAAQKPKAKPRSRR